MSLYHEFKAEIDPFTVDADIEEGLEPKWWTLAENLINEKPSESPRLIEEFKEAIIEDEFLQSLGIEHKLTDDGFLKRFLRAGTWKVDEAMTILKTYSGLGKEYKTYVTRAIPSKLDSVWNAKINTMTEKRDKYGRRIYFFRLGKWDPDKVHLDDFYASAYIFLEMIAREVKTQIAGVTVINDVSGFGFRHLRCLGLEEMRAIIAFMNGAFPLWFRKIHIVNQPRLFGVLFNMVKPFLPDKVKDNIVFHGSNFDGLHAEVCRELLPDELGGTGGANLDNSASVAAAKNLDDFFKEHCEKALEVMENNNNKSTNANKHK